jgi:uncharacterized membrane protein
MIPVQHIHPMLVHFPIVLIFLLAAFDVLASVLGYSVTGRTVSGNISTGLVVATALFAMATFYFGGLALDVAESGGFHSDVAETHESLGEMVAIVTGIYALIRAAIWFKDYRISGATSFLFPLAAIAISILVASTAFFGGQLVYELGVNVAKIASN